MHPAVAQSLFVRKPDPLGPFLVVSLVVHAAVVGGILAVGYLDLPPPIDMNQKPITASLVRLGKPREPNLLPVKEEPVPPPQKIEAAEKPPEPVKTPDPVVAVPIPGVKPTPEPTQSQKQNGELSDAQRRKQLFGAFSKTAKQSKVQELEGQLDGNPFGDSATSQGEQYWALISTQIRRNYDVSQTIPEQERLHLIAQVVLFIGRSGDVLRAKLVKGSGNPMFDNAVMAASKKAGPFPPPPDHLRNTLQTNGVRLEFRP
jgi:TonB family protein